MHASGELLAHHRRDVELLPRAVLHRAVEVPPVLLLIHPCGHVPHIVFVVRGDVWLAQRSSNVCPVLGVVRNVRMVRVVGVVGLGNFLFRRLGSWCMSHDYFGGLVGMVHVYVGAGQGEAASARGFVLLGPRTSTTHVQETSSSSYTHTMTCSMLILQYFMFNLCRYIYHGIHIPTERGAVPLTESTPAVGEGVHYAKRFRMQYYVMDVCLIYPYYMQSFILSEV